MKFVTNVMPYCAHRKQSGRLKWDRTGIKKLEGFENCTYLNYLQIASYGHSVL
jgi:hypothetical protein